MNEENLRLVKKKLLMLLLSTADALSLEEIEYNLRNYDVSSTIIRRMLDALVKNDIVCKEKDGYLLTHIGRRRLTVMLKRKKHEKNKNRQKIICGSIVLAILLLLLSWCIFFVDRTPPSPTPDVPDNPTQPEKPLPEVPSDDYEIITLSKDDLSQGCLILVNADNKYNTVPENLINIYENKSDFFVPSTALETRPDVLAALNKMAGAYVKEKEKSDIMVYTAYVSEETQKAEYEEALEKYTLEEIEKEYQKPGFADAQTGYSVSFVRYFENTVLSVKNTELYDWLIKNASDYGFILRFPEGKESETGMIAHFSVFRFVSDIHSGYISENNLCLEEYIALLKEKYNDTTKPLEITTEKGSYSVYYISGFSVPVPMNKEYSISGDNSEGFIVTYLNE